MTKKEITLESLGYEIDSDYNNERVYVKKDNGPDFDENDVFEITFFLKTKEIEKQLYDERIKAHYDYSFTYNEILACAKMIEKEVNK